MNIKNKAMINGITACSLNEIMIKLMSKLVKNTKTQKIMHKMGIMCSSIICDCMKAAYGDIWSKMDMMSTPPWSLAECLKRFKKYWTAVFREKLMKQFTKTLQSLLDVIESNKCGYFKLFEKFETQTAHNLFLLISLFMEIIFSRYERRLCGICRVYEIVCSAVCILKRYRRVQRFCGMHIG